MHPMRIVILLVLAPLAAARADIVINEVFYNAPDDLDDLQWIELHNTAGEAVDLSDWVLDWGGEYRFAKGSTIEAHGYLVTALDPQQFQRIHGAAAMGPWQRPLKRNGERIELRNAGGERVDFIRYKDREPWPLSADGYSASLERICPSSPGDVPENWAASPIPAASPKPAGTPGKRNASYSNLLPPVISSMSATPQDPLPGQPLLVEATVKDQGMLRQVHLLYRIITGGVEGDEMAVAMVGDERGRFQATIPPQAANALVRYRVRAVSEAGAERLFPAEHDLRPSHSIYVHDKWELSQIPIGLIIHVRPPQTAPANAPGPPQGGPGRPGGVGGPGAPGAAPPGGFGPMRRGITEPRPARGSSAFVHVDHQTGRTTLFDYVNAVQRGGGRGHNIFFHKDQRLSGMSAVSIVFEGNERFLLAEALAYDLYRRAGNAASLTQFVRLSVDGRVAGYHLMIERPNRSFLRRNQRRDDGNLYKLIWYGRGIIGQHEKKTNVQAGHDDLLAILELLQKTRGDEQWEVIREHFNVDQVATYFAVNAILSHWDGFFNNYFAYHDVHGTKRWEMYPWDQDKTWGYHDGIRPDTVFFDMPLTFGMEGDQPPSARGVFGRIFGAGPIWWRPGGHFSSPLLANPHFRKIFLARTQEILDTIYTEEIYFPLIDAMAGRLKEDAVLRARVIGADGESGTRLLARNVESLRTHLLKRRQFLLEQDELRALNRNPAPAAQR